MATKQRFYLHYHFGSCIDQSMSAGFEEYEALEEAVAQRDHLLKWAGVDASGGEFTIVRGVLIEEVSPP